MGASNSGVAHSGAQSNYYAHRLVEGIIGMHEAMSTHDSITGSLEAAQECARSLKRKLTVLEEWVDERKAEDEYTCHDREELPPSSPTYVSYVRGPYLLSVGR